MIMMIMIMTLVITTTTLITSHGVSAFCSSSSTSTSSTRRSFRRSNSDSSSSSSTSSSSSSSTCRFSSFSNRNSSNNYLERRRRSSGLVDKLIQEVTKKPKDQINEGNIGDYITELSSLSSTNDNERQLQALLPLFSTDNDTNTDNNETTTTTTATATTSLDKDLLFKPLLGYFDVAHTLTSNPNENPVGGKWTRGSRFTKKLWTVKRTMQHILPPLPVGQSALSPTVVVAQVINAIKLEILGGFISIWVLLRGDGVPLQLALSTEEEKDKQQRAFEDDESKKKKNNKNKTTSPKPLLPNLSDRTVKAYFDRPRIGISLFRTRKKTNNYLFQKAVSLGPTSAVVLDSPYVDNRVRLGMGATSGTQFVFRRIQEKENDVEGTDEWKWVLDNMKDKSTTTTKKKKKKRSVILRVAFVLFVGNLLSKVVFHGGILMYTIRTTKLQQASWLKIVMASIVGICSSFFLMIFPLLRTGGIESNDNSYISRKKE